ncbi:MAG: hypothetical protein K2P69_04715 [Eubacterium sp.]|nr:hypothetical protein [Eubacterium sp.]
MEDSYANYTIDPEALRQGLEVLGMIVGAIGIGASICNPIGGSAAAIAGLSTAIGVSCDSLTVISYFSEGDVQGALDSATLSLGGIGGDKCNRRMPWGKIRTGAGKYLTEDEIERLSYLFKEVPELVMEKATVYKEKIDETEVEPIRIHAGQKVLDAVFNSNCLRPPIP